MRRTISAKVSFLFICLASFSSAVQLVKGPTSQRVTQGQTVTLECSVSSIQAGESIVWKHVDLGEKFVSVNHLLYVTEPDLRRRYSVIWNNQKRDFHLKIVDLKAIDGGSYECGYTDSRQSFIRLAGATITVDVPMEGAPVCDAQPKTSQLGDTVTLKCSASGGVSAPTLIWESNGRELAKQIGTSFLTFDKQMRQSDVGASFMCRAISSLYPTGPFCTITPLPHPLSVTIRANAPFYKVGDNATFLCTEHSGAPNVEYAWPKVDIQILMSRRYLLKDNNRVLTIINLEAEHNNSILECQAKTADNRVSEGASMAIRILNQIVTTSTIQPTVLSPFKVEKNSLHPAVIVVFVLLVVAIVVILALVLIRYSRRKSQQSSLMKMGGK
ncbi:uncharacterized protein LOC117117405 [Anneissia japonica]|uniref:uncharacterized protein LOC117117405 n=1 Tax=Anneissia japonica TaxID=1529436 RepID=UPI001425A842|nr:uncharacterized protein LOC117117405 [Anneissia japonica]